jgi:hypothetical protein
MGGSARPTSDDVQRRTCLGVVDSPTTIVRHQAGYGRDGRRLCPAGATQIGDARRSGADDSDQGLP